MQSSKNIIYNELLSITIDGIQFILLNKCNDVSTGDTIVRIKSIDITDEEYIFSCYQSNSGVGLWRFCSEYNNEGSIQKYKGNGTTYNYDYVQTTMIHLKLQIFINENKNKIDQISICKRCIFITNKESSKYKKIIDSDSRTIIEEPFISLHEQLQCGELPPTNVPKTYIDEFSIEFENTYKILGEPIVVSAYNNVFEDIIEVTGHIYSIQLKRKNIKPKSETKTNIITLYYIKVQLKSLNEHQTIFKNKINRICKQKYHYMPIILTGENLRINQLGLYEEYILAGIYICKIFDYYGTYKQCSVEEVKSGACTETYAYIGDRYKNIFPYNILSRSDVKECMQKLNDNVLSKNKVHENIQEPSNSFLNNTIKEKFKNILNYNIDQEIIDREISVQKIKNLLITLPKNNNIERTYQVMIEKYIKQISNLHNLAEHRKILFNNYKKFIS